MVNTCHYSKSTVSMWRHCKQQPYCPGIQHPLVYVCNPDLKCIEEYPVRALLFLALFVDNNLTIYRSPEQLK